MLIFSISTHLQFFYFQVGGHTEVEHCKKKNDRTNKRCTHCGSNTHTINRCFELHPHLRMQKGNQHANGRGNRLNNHSFNNWHGNDRRKNNNCNQYRQGPPKVTPSNTLRRRNGGGGYKHNVANVNGGPNFLLASIEISSKHPLRIPKKYSFAKRLAKSHKDQITKHLKKGTE